MNDHQFLYRGIRAADYMNNILSHDRVDTNTIDTPVNTHLSIDKPRLLS